MMSRDVKSCRDREPLVKAAQLMWEHDIGSVPVIDDSGGLVGIITDRDCVMAAYTQGRRLDEIMIRTVMSKNPHTCQPSDTLENAAMMMKKAQVRRLPVVDKKGKLMAMVSLTDLSRAAEQEPNQRVREQYMHQVEQTLAAAGRPRLPARA